MACRNDQRHFVVVKVTEPHETFCHSADTYFYEAVAELSVGFLPTTAANMVIMGIYRCTAVGLWNLHYHKLLTLRWCIINTPLMHRWRSVAPVLTLCWRSDLGHRNDVVASIFALTGGQSFHYGLMSPVTHSIFHEIRPTIVDGPLMLIFRTC